MVRVSVRVSKDIQPSGSVLQHVGHNIRQLRGSCGLSQAALAERAGVSRRMLVAIEAGETNVSLGTLDRIAGALDIPFSQLVQAPEWRGSERVDELAWTGAAGGRAMLLGTSRARREVELWEWRLEPGECYAGEADAVGWSEQIYVAEGSLTLVIQGSHIVLAPGQFHVFASDCEYFYRNDSDGTVRFIRNVVF